MTVRVERTFELPAEPEEVWSFIADPEKRARPISVVTDFEQTGEHAATWYLKLPIPVVDRSIAVETEDTQFEPPTEVEFVGRSKVMRVVGEHELEPIDGGTRLITRFTVDGKLPGVERYFKRNMDQELHNIEQALLVDLGIEA
ncbi:CoxG family protein [Halorientalis brevis]|uniref:CoxG family protein n=1 Tax=Halorientalis brevis TaxID=1126241 RepID=A0ABD6CGQ4_9EURY|nr:SRPBCC family protein [Halorientalis brevis]